MQCCGVFSLQPLCRGVQCAKQMLECCPHPAQPAQHSTAQLGSAQISRAKFLGMEFINQMGLSPLQPELATSHRAQPGVDYTEKLFDNIHLFNSSSNLDNVNVDDVVEF